MSAQIRLAQLPGSPKVVSFPRFFALADRYAIIPDELREQPELAKAVHEGRVYFEVVKDAQVIGYLWLDGYFAGTRRAEFGAVVLRSHRRQWSNEAWPGLVSMLKFFFYDGSLLEDVNNAGLGLPRLTVYLPRGRRYAETFIKKLGFAYEGRHLDFFKIQGKESDAIVFALTRGNFNRLIEMGYYDHGPYDSSLFGAERAWPGESLVRGGRGAVQLSRHGAANSARESEPGADPQSDLAARTA